MTFRISTGRIVPSPIICAGSAPFGRSTGPADGASRSPVTSCISDRSSICSRACERLAERGVASLQLPEANEEIELFDQGAPSTARCNGVAQAANAAVGAMLTVSCEARATRMRIVRWTSRTRGKFPEPSRARGRDAAIRLCRSEESAAIARARRDGANCVAPRAEKRATRRRHMRAPCRLDGGLTAPPCLAAYAPRRPIRTQHRDIHGRLLAGAARLGESGGDDSRVGTTLDAALVALRSRSRRRERERVRRPEGLDGDRTARVHGQRLRAGARALDALEEPHRR